jgi:hypothetical protein
MLETRAAASSSASESLSLAPASDLESLSDEIGELLLPSTLVEEESERLDVVAEFVETGAKRARAE